MLQALRSAFPALPSSFTFHLPSACFFSTVPSCSFWSFSPWSCTRAPSTTSRPASRRSTARAALPGAPARAGHPPRGALDSWASASSGSLAGAGGLATAWTGAAASLGVHPPPVPKPAVGVSIPCLEYSSKNEPAYHSGGSILHVVMCRTFDASWMDRSASGFAFRKSAEANAFHLIPMLPTAPHISVTASISGRSYCWILSSQEFAAM
mmetsp:Transcript_96068/g.271942  ORF Transcript_96068/g.271942 Transcript_96068/m.271942 type:complete len:209 (+) Transcript_96068:125-751(+)